MMTPIATNAAPAMRLSQSDQRALMPYARLIRYGTGELIQAPGEVPKTITVLVSGRVRLTVPAGDGSVTAVRSLDKGALLGVAAFTHQANLAYAHALDEVTLLQIEHDEIQRLLTDRPLLSREFGRLIDERRTEVQSVRSAAKKATQAAGQVVTGQDALPSIAAPGGQGAESR